MRKTSIILIALLAVLFAQCKKENIETDANTGTGSDVRKVKVRCEIPLNDGSKSDFTNILTNGKINWSNGRECVYLAVTGNNPQIIELEGYANDNPHNLEFTAEAPEGLLSENETYELWYFGHSQQLDNPYVIPTFENDEMIVKIDGSIATQSGQLNDLGHCHIASGTATASIIDDEIVLSLNKGFENKIAIAYINRSNGIDCIYGSAVIGTEYALEYDAANGKYEFKVTENSEANINILNPDENSYIVLFPNDGNNIQLHGREAEYNPSSSVCSYRFRNKIKANKIYYKTGSDGISPEPLEWDYSTEIVDLGLSVKWASCNVGASSPEEYGNYYAWGETETKSIYETYTSLTYGLTIQELKSQGYIDESSNLTSQHDAASANWGEIWRMPTVYELWELLYECTWTWTTQNSVAGYTVTGPNGNNIFLPAAGLYNNDIIYYTGKIGYYFGSSVSSEHYNESFLLHFSNNNNDYGFNLIDRSIGASVRPVLK